MSLLLFELSTMKAYYITINNYVQKRKIKQKYAQKSRPWCRFLKPGKKIMKKKSLNEKYEDFLPDICR
jgi:hypothetical protein